MIRQYDSFFPWEVHKDLRNMMYSDEFPWYWGKTTDNMGVCDAHTKETNFYCHCFFSETTDRKSFLYDNVKDLLPYVKDKIGMNFKLHTLKANMYHPHPGFKKDNYHPIHIDFVLKNYYSLLIFLDLSDGNLRLFDKGLEAQPTEITPDYNKAVLFPSAMPHASSNPIITNKRLNLFLVFKSEETLQDNDTKIRAVA